MRDLIEKERGSTLAGIVLFSDGGQNAGISPEAAVELAREAKRLYLQWIGFRQTTQERARKRL